MNDPASADEDLGHSFAQKLREPINIFTIVLVLAVLSYGLMPDGLRAMWMFYVLACGAMANFIWMLVRAIR